MQETDITTRTVPVDRKVFFRLGQLLKVISVCRVIQWLILVLRETVLCQTGWEAACWLMCIPYCWQLCKSQNDPTEGKGGSPVPPQSPEEVLQLNRWNGSPLGTWMMSAERGEWVQAMSAGDKRPWSVWHSLQSMQLCQGLCKQELLKQIRWK